TLERIDACCQTCGVPGDQSPCEACLASPPEFDRARGVYRYGAAIAQVLHRFKYEDHPELARPLGRLLGDLSLEPPDVVAPIPLHPARRRSRTYDQALYLAQGLSEARKWPLQADLVARVKSTER